MIERDMAERETKEDMKLAEINRYYAYTNQEVEFEATLERCTKHHIQFWKLMLDKDPDIRSVEELGAKVTKSKEEAKAEFE